MDNKKRQSIFNKIKTSIGIILLILLITIPAWIYFQLMILNPWLERETMARYGLLTVMERSLKQPSGIRHQENNNIYVKNDLLDLEPITKEEWMNVECSSPYKGYSKDKSVFTEDFIAHTTCIKPFVLGGGCLNPNANSGRIFRTSINTSLSGIFDSPCISISFNEYILRYPKILNNIIKIAEKPCDYLKGQALRNNLYCDKPKKAWYEAEKSCVVINIYGTEGYKKTQIRVPRQDNKHLLKGQKEWDAKLLVRNKSLEDSNKE